VVIDPGPRGSGQLHPRLRRRGWKCAGRGGVLQGMVAEFQVKVGHTVLALDHRRRERPRRCGRDASAPLGAAPRAGRSSPVIFAVPSGR